MVSEKKGKKLENTVSLFISRSAHRSSEMNKTGSWRFSLPVYKEKTAPCSAACPTGTEIPRVEMHMSKGEVRKAWDKIIWENPFPAVCGRVCFHDCEGACNRKNLDSAVGINSLEKFIGDIALSESYTFDEVNETTNKRVAIIGAGPSGLSAAYFLSKLGFSCEVFEKESEAGGVMRWGIPSYRLPKNILLDEIKRIEDLGVKIHCNKELSIDEFNNIKNEFDAVYLGCGLGASISPGFEGESLLEEGAIFLKRVESEKMSLDGQDIAVIGGGNTAIDVARSLIRTGAKATILYRRRKEDMPAFIHEISAAENEGVKIVELVSPTCVKNKGEMLEIDLQQMTTGDIDSHGRMSVRPLGGKRSLIYNKIISGIGNQIKDTWHSPDQNNSKMELKNSIIDMTGDTPLVYGGDLTNKNQSVSDAIASGKEIAIVLDLHFKGDSDIIDSLEKCRVGVNALSFEIYRGSRKQYKEFVEFKNVNIDYFDKEDRNELPQISKDESINSFNEVEKNYTFQMAANEALRCFNCGFCNDCDNCRVFCPDASIIIEDGKRVINTDFCKGCGVCVTECPRSAMGMEEEKV